MKQALCFILIGFILAPVAVLAETVDMLDYQINELMRRHILLPSRQLLL